MCGSDLHIYHGRVKIDPGFTIGHEYVGTVTAIGDDVRNVAVGDRVLGCFQTACGHCFFCRRGWFHKCDASRTFGHGATLGSLQGTQAEQALVPSADLVLRKVPDGMSEDVALFAGDVMGTGYHAAAESGLQPGDVAAVLGLGPVGPLRGAGGVRGRRGARDRDRHRARAPEDGRVLRRAGRAPDRGGPARGCAQAADRRARRRRLHRRGRRPARAGAGDPPDAQVRHACRRSACTPSAARCTWGFSGSRR